MRYATTTAVLLCAAACGGSSSEPVTSPDGSGNPTGSSGTAASSGASSGAAGAGGSSGSSSSSGGTGSSGGTTSSSGGSSGAATSGAPTAVTDLQLTNQAPSSQSLAWTAANPGQYPIAHYKIYRNGAPYDTAPASATTYTDNNAPNSTVTGADNNNNPESAATVYSYDVSAVDTQGNEGPRASQMTAWWFHDGTFSAGGEYSNPTPASNGSQSTTDWCSTSVSSPEGTCVAYVTSTNWWQPYSGGSISPEYAMDVGAFNYLVMDIQTTASQTFLVAFFSRGPQGDVFNNLTITLPTDGTDTFGDPAVPGKWVHYKLPLTPTANAIHNLGFGFGQGSGWFDGTTLNATAWTSGVKFEPCTWLTGNGVAPNTMIIQANCAGCAGENGTSTGLVQAGGYSLTQSQSVGSASAPINLALQRTNAYKLHVQANGGAPYYVDNLGFTRN
jgi:hypothetical protein